MKTTTKGHTFSSPGGSPGATQPVVKSRLRSVAFVLSLVVAVCSQFAPAAHAQIIMTFGNSDSSAIQVSSGQQVDVPVTVANLAGVSSMQFTLNWAPTELQYVSTLVKNSVFLGTQIGNVGGGKLTVLWDDPLSVGPASASGDIFTFRFNVIGANGTGSTLSFGDDPTPRHLYDVEVADISGVQWNSGSVSIAAVPEPATAGLLIGVVCLLQAVVFRMQKRHPQA